MKSKFFLLKDSYKIPLILTGVVLLFTTAIFMTTYCEKRADIYLLPEGFNGTATVFFNEPAGAPENRSGEKRTFKIPASGTLHTQSNYKTKWNNYYYVKPDGSLRQLMYGDARMAGGVSYRGDFDSVWVQEMNVSELDTNGKKLTFATIIVKRNY